MIDRTMTPVAAAVAEATDAHFEAGPSALPRVILCPASVSASRPFPNTTNAAAEHGTGLHSLLEICLKSRLYPRDFPTDGEWAIYTQDDRDAVTEVVEFVREMLVEYPGELLVEFNVDLSMYWPGMRGTADVVIVAGKTLIVIDAKFGRIKVRASSPQLKAYAVGVLRDFEFVDFESVVCAIAQPFAGHFESVTYTAAEIDEWASTVMVPALANAFGPNPTFNPGPDQCIYCRANGVCIPRKAAHFDEVASILDKVPADGYANGYVLTSDELGAILAKADAFESVLGDMKAHAMRELLAGKAVPGMKLVESVTKRKWADPESAPQLLYEALIQKKPDVDPVAALGMVTRVEPITITAAEKLLGKTNPALAGMTVKPEGKPSLAPESDSRPAFNPKSAALDALDQIEI